MLDEAYAAMCSGGDEVWRGMELLATGLRERRLASDAHAWRHWVTTTCLVHPVGQLVYTDPFTLRAYAKPRGYPGDAVLLDYIYGNRHDPSLEDTAARIHQFTINGALPRAVRHRREVLAGRIDTVAEEFAHPRVLAFAAGHLREAQISRALQAGKIDRLVAVDQDAESVECVAREYGRLGVEAVCGTVKQILAGELVFRGFHLVYAAGLFDYLPQSIAKRLTRHLLRMLAPGGRLLVANFLPGIADVGYMESFMDWLLLYRDEAALVDVFGAIPREEIGDVERWSDPDRNIVFAEAWRR